MVKDDARLSSLLGTWTGQSRIKAFSVGHYELLVYFVVHLMPDPMRGYGCLSSTSSSSSSQSRIITSKGDTDNHVAPTTALSCNEMDNQVCIEHDTNEQAEQSCVDITNTTIPWSDVTAFLYFGARVDAGIPFNVHLEHNTSGWIGPFNLILAQDDNNTTNTTNTTTTDKASNHPKLLLVQPKPDRYVARYVKTPSTSFLQMHPHCTLFRQEDFEHYMGATAVNETVHAQTRVSHGEDPYAPYLGNCSQGNVKPILPLYEFAFLPQSNSNNNNNNNSSSSGGTTSDQLQIKLDYKIMTMPHPKDIAYKLMPRLQSLFNKNENGEFHISGPYCYGDDPHRGWTFDFSYDSQERTKKQYMSVVKGCVESLPCVPPAGMLLEYRDAQHHIYYNASNNGNDSDNGNGNTSLHLGQIFISIMCYILLLALLVSITCNCRQAQQVKRLQTNHNNNNNHNNHHDDNQRTTTNGTGAPPSSDDDDNDLLQPLLSQAADHSNAFDGTDHILAQETPAATADVSNETTTTTTTESANNNNHKSQPSITTV